jgi:hypothetical protein
VGGHLGCSEIFGGGLQNWPGHFHQIINMLLESSSQFQSIGTLVG